MRKSSMTRRDYLKLLGASGAMAAIGPSVACTPAQKQVAKPAAEEPGEPASAVADRARRMEWWHAAKFGMFIHWGLYCVIGQHEWAMEAEGIPIPQYELLAKHFNPKPNAARTGRSWPRQAGQKYMVMTTKHHEGLLYV